MHNIKLDKYICCNKYMNLIAQDEFHKLFYCDLCGRRRRMPRKINELALSKVKNEGYTYNEAFHIFHIK